MWLGCKVDGRLDVFASFSHLSNCLQAMGWLATSSFAIPLQYHFVCFNLAMLLNVFLGGCVCVLRFRGVLDREVLVSSTSNELLHRFGTWDASALKDWGDSTGFNRVSTA